MFITAAARGFRVRRAEGLTTVLDVGGDTSCIVERLESEETLCQQFRLSRIFCGVKVVGRKCSGAGSGSEVRRGRGMQGYKC